MCTTMQQKGEEKEEEEEEKKKTTVMVGFKMDADGRELLTWSLVKAADAGDRVLALHVLPSSSYSSAAGPSYQFLSLVKTFDAVLEAFDGLCELKQVDLEMKVARGSSVRRVLVREAVANGASKLVLGVSKGNHSIMYSSTSVAKYCARKLPQDCSVFAVSNGKNLFKSKALCSSPQQLIPNQSKSNSNSGSFQPESKATSTIKIPEELQHLQEKYSPACRLFSSKEVLRMTSDFSPENLIGKGGSSHVYKNRLPDGQELALKVLKPSETVMEEFAAEIKIITSLHHKNIVSLVGFCCEKDKLTLVYNFLSGGSLEDNLHGWSSSKRALGWAERYRIAVGVAEALDYLHCSVSDGPSSRSVIHRDVKSTNILLSDAFEPQLADFGLAMWASSSGSQLICNDVAGTFGYLAPEYFMYGKVNEKIDVYAFGVVLLELVSGRKPVSSGMGSPPKEQKSLVMWAMPILQGGKLEELVDPCLASSYERDELEKMALAASLCIRRSPRLRPPMNLVLKLLRGDEDVLQWARSQVFAPKENDDDDDLDDEEAALENNNNNNNIRSHITLALQETEDDTSSISSIEPPTASMSAEEYLQGRWSRTSSFD